MRLWLQHAFEDTRMAKLFDVVRMKGMIQPVTRLDKLFMSFKLFNNTYLFFYKLNIADLLIYNDEIDKIKGGDCLFKVGIRLQYSFTCLSPSFFCMTFYFVMNKTLFLFALVNRSCQA